MIELPLPTASKTRNNLLTDFVNKKENAHQRCMAFLLGDMVVYYLVDRVKGRTGFSIVPFTALEEVVIGRADFADHKEIQELPEEWRPMVPRQVFSLGQLRLSKDAFNEGPSGTTMLNGETSNDFQFVEQVVEDTTESVKITTRLVSSKGIRCDHVIEHIQGEDRLGLTCVYVNDGNITLDIEMASSYTLSDLSPFDKTCSHNRLTLHRFRTNWSREARLVSCPIEELQMSPSWHVAHSATEKIGQVGTWSTNDWYPQMLLEDTKAGITWGVRLAWSGSWQMELFRQDDQVHMAGGLADYNYGHWFKTLAPGQSITTPTAFMTVDLGSVDQVCNRLLNSDAERSRSDSMFTQFNDWCTNWGTPSEKSVKELSTALEGKGFDYQIIDAGWYKPKNGNWNMAQGDWVPSEDLYPSGLKASADIIDQHGMKPGLWFEFETVGIDADMFGQTDLLLKLNGNPITVGVRRFLDFRQQETWNYLQEKVIELIKTCGFKYIKIDYNSSIGKGVDGAESIGEGLREHLLQVTRFMQHLRSSVPDLVIEDCASGGMRLDPHSLSLADMGSFSDAHASPEIPVIAARIRRVMHPSKNLIWAVLRPEESLERIGYSMAATFYGRVCVSGDIHGLSSTQIALMEAYLDIYKNVSHLVYNGETRLYGNEIFNYRQPEGCQVGTYVNQESGELLVVAHSFKNGAKVITLEELKVQKIIDQCTNGVSAAVEEGKLTIRFQEDFRGGVFHVQLKKDKK